MKLSPIVCASFVALAALALTGANAQAPPKTANNYTCWAFVTWKDAQQTGFNPITGPNGNGPMTGSSASYSAKQSPNVNGATISAAASMCHGLARNAFLADKAWSDPDQVCESENNPGKPDKYGRTFTGTVTVWAIDRFKEISETPQKYNRVDSYVVRCNKKKNTATWTHGLKGGVLPF